MPSCQTHCIGHLIAQVLVHVLQGPIAHQVPHDLVGMASPDFSRLHQEHQVHLGLLIQLQDLEDFLFFQDLEDFLFVFCFSGP